MPSCFNAARPIFCIRYYDADGSVQLIAKGAADHKAGLHRRGTAELNTQRAAPCRRCRRRRFRQIPTLKVQMGRFNVAKFSWRIFVGLECGFYY